MTVGSVAAGWCENPWRMSLELDAAQSFYGDALRMPVSTNPMASSKWGFRRAVRCSCPTNPTCSRHDTVLNFGVDDIDAAADDLNARGTVTKAYTDPDIGTDEKGTARRGRTASTAPRSCGSPTPRATCSRC